MRWKTSKCGRKLKSIHMGPSKKLKMIYPIQNYIKNLYMSLSPHEVKVLFLVLLMCTTVCLFGGIFTRVPLPMKTRKEW